LGPRRGFFCTSIRKEHSKKPAKKRPSVDRAGGEGSAGVGKKGGSKLRLGGAPGQDLSDKATSQGELRTPVRMSAMHEMWEVLRAKTKGRNGKVRTDGRKAQTGTCLDESAMEQSNETKEKKKRC